MLSPDPDAVIASPTDPETLRESYAACRRLTQAAAGNFRYTFLPLPAAKRRQMDAVYAFMRVCDDLADDESLPTAERARRLAAWRAEFDRAVAGEPVSAAVLPAIADVVRDCSIPERYLLDVIEGVTSDLTPTQPADLAALETYCYRVAGAVGLACIHVWGFRDDGDAVAAAIDCGFALQLTNILRDVREDAEAGRVYLPADECARFGVTRESFLADTPTPGVEALLRFQIERARDAYRRGRRLLPLLEPAGRPVLRAMLRLYGGILRKIAADPAAVLTGRVALPKWRKLAIAGVSMAGL
ncbi:MAG: phytoene/squalene synthase family protein [Planctomycetota bacterium]